MLLDKRADLGKQRMWILDERDIEPVRADAHEAVNEMLQHVILELGDRAEMGIERATVIFSAGLLTIRER